MEIRLVVPSDFKFYPTFQDTTRQPFGLTELLINDIYCTTFNGQVIEIVHDQKENILRVSARFDTADQFTAALRYRFGLTQNLELFYQRIADDPCLTGLIGQLTGLRVFQKSAPFEALVTAIADQQVNLAFAETLKRRLILKYGRSINHRQVTLFEFPTPERLAACDELELNHLQFTRNKSRSIIRLAQGVAAGNIDLSAWQTLADDQLLDKLMSIHGVGRWTAEYVALIAYSRLNMLPAADIGLMNAVQKLYGLEHRPDEQELRKIGAAWEPFRGLVTFYLWFGLEQKII